MAKYVHTFMVSFEPAIEGGDPVWRMMLTGKREMSIMDLFPGQSRAAALLPPLVAADWNMRQAKITRVEHLHTVRVELDLTEVYT